MDITIIIERFGFPVIVACGFGYFIYFIWKYVTMQIKPKLVQAFVVLVNLIDRVRMLDNDLIRLDQKLNVVLEMREEQQQEKLKDLEHEKE